MIHNHKDLEVRKALIKLCDALCSWERATGIETVLVIRDSEGSEFVADSGKPTTAISGIDLLNVIEEIMWEKRLCGKRHERK